MKRNPPRAAGEEGREFTEYTTKAQRYPCGTGRKKERKKETDIKEKRTEMKQPMQRRAPPLLEFMLR